MLGCLAVAGTQPAGAEWLHVLGQGVKKVVRETRRQICQNTQDKGALGRRGELWERRLDHKVVHSVIFLRHALKAGFGAEGGASWSLQD